MRHLRLRISFILVSFVVVFLAGWLALYPSSSDPKNIKYVLWKAGFYRLDPDIALATMIGDPPREGLVLGKTKAELRDKFSSLVTPADASPYLEGCYQGSSWKDKHDVLFIRQSSWMVVFDHGKATDLVLIKGC
ncbi:MAG: hypothetical protein ACRD59_11815 [Candidatus Acidiferrales bacterium]